MQITPIPLLPLSGLLLILIASSYIVKLIRFAGGKWQHERSQTFSDVAEGFVIGAVFYLLRTLPFVDMLEQKLAAIENNLPFGLQYWGIALVSILLGFWGWTMYTKSRLGSLKKKGWMLLFGLALVQLGIAIPPLGTAFEWIAVVMIPSVWNFFVSGINQLVS